MILAFDTSSALTSVAVVDGDEVVAEASHLDARRHAEVMSPLLVTVIAGIDRARIDAIACGVGPGPYTGLRVGIATALAVGLAWEIPVHGICSSMPSRPPRSTRSQRPTAVHRPGRSPQGGVLGAICG